MAKFIALKRNRKLMKFAGLLSDRLNEPTNDFLKSINTYYFLTIITGYFISAGIVTRRFKTAAQFEDMMDLFYGVVGIFQSIALYVTIGIEMRKIKTMVLTLQEVIDEGNAKNAFNRHEFQLQ